MPGCRGGQCQVRVDGHDFIVGRGLLFFGAIITAKKGRQGAAMTNGKYRWVAYIISICHPTHPPGSVRVRVANGNWIQPPTEDTNSGAHSRHQCEIIID